MLTIGELLWIVFWISFSHLRQLTKSWHSWKVDDLLCWLISLLTILNWHKICHISQLRCVMQLHLGLHLWLSPTSWNRYVLFFQFLIICLLALGLLMYTSITVFKNKENYTDTAEKNVLDQFNRWFDYYRRRSRQMLHIPSFNDIARLISLIRSLIVHYQIYCTHRPTVHMFVQSRNWIMGISQAAWRQEIVCNSSEIYLRVIRCDSAGFEQLTTQVELILYSYLK